MMIFSCNVQSGHTGFRLTSRCGQLGNENNFRESVMYVVIELNWLHEQADGWVKSDDMSGMDLAL
jgi:hypothetical protein